MRLAPAALSLAFVAFVFLPSYWRYEPREFVEGFDVTLTTLAALALAIVGTAVARGVTAWRRAARRTRRMDARGARRSRCPSTSMPAFAIDTDAPVMALVGVLRPRLLITRPVLEALTDEELRASVAHELGHWRACDNLKRLAMRAAPDLLVRHRRRARASSGAGRRRPSTSRIAPPATAAAPVARSRRRWSRSRA